MLKYKGKSYVSLNGRPFLGRYIKPACGSTCRFQCSTKITTEQRQRLFDEYYALGNIARQWEFLGSCMDKTIPKRKQPKNSSRNSNKKRTNNILYFLSFDNQRHRVCKHMFLSTFAISDATTLTVIQKTDDNGTLIDMDRRGRNSQPKSSQV